MFAIAIFVAGLVIALSWAAQRSDVEDVAANNKPSDDDTKPSNDFALSRSMGRTREMVPEADRAKLTDLQPKQDQFSTLSNLISALCWLEQKSNEQTRNEGPRASCGNYLEP
jgi:hypothetical protein